MGKKKEVEVEEPAVDKKATKEAKKAQKLEVKAELKALSLSHVPPAFVTDTDCDAVLKSLKLPVSLPLLTVKYDTHRSINKAASFYSKTKAAHRFLMEEPSVTWDGLCETECTLLLIDVDAPERDGDGATAGKRSPWLHWMVTNAKHSAGAGKTVTDYMAPSPAIGAHRYLFLLFQGSLADSLRKREARIHFDIPALLKENPALKPLAFNFMYVTAA